MQLQDITNYWAIQYFEKHIRRTFTYFQFTVDLHVVVAMATIAEF